MPLTKHQRKEALGHGGVTRIHKSTGYALSTVSEVLNDKARNEEIEDAIASAIGKPRFHVFPKAPRKTARRENA